MRRNLILAAAALSAGMLAGTSSALADTYTFNATYYQVKTGSPDFYNGDAPIGISHDFVKSTLGPDGLPVYNPAYTSASGTVQAPDASYLNASGELLYWTPGTYVKATGSGLLTLSSNPIDMFPPNSTGTNNSGYQETAVLTSSFTLATPTAITFNVGADDMAFVYVDGSLIESLGGIHSNASAPSATLTYGAGIHNIQLFYADRDITQASLSFSEDGITPVNPVPEPGSFLLLGSGLLGVAGAVRRHLFA